MEGKREAFGKEGEMDVVKAELSCMTECKFMTFGEGRRGKMERRRKGKLDKDEIKEDRISEKKKNRKWEDKKERKKYRLKEENSVG